MRVHDSQEYRKVDVIRERKSYHVMQSCNVMMSYNVMQKIL